MQYHPTKLRIDISKKTFDVCLLNGGKPKYERFGNNPEGFKMLENWLTKVSSTELHIGMEATGNYWKALARHLTKSSHQVSVINPYKIKKFGELHLHRNKTDKADAKLIASYCLQEGENLLLWQDVDEETKHLRELIQYRDNIQLMIGQLKNRIESIIEDESVLLMILEDKAHLEQRLIIAEEKVKIALKASEEMKRKSELLQTIPGVGPVVASYFLALVPDISAFKRKEQVVAFLGLNPRINQSGTSVKGKSTISRMGNSTVRGKLYLPAIMATIHNPIIKNLAERMRATGHVNREIYVAAMRKLVVQMYGVLRSGKPFDPNYVNLVDQTP